MVMLSLRVFIGAGKMNLTQARNAIIVLSFLTSLVALVFFLLAHFFLPLEPEESFQIVQLVVPVFLGYVGSCIHFIFTPEPVNPRVNNSFLLCVMVFGPFFSFGSRL